MSQAWGAARSLQCASGSYLPTYLRARHWHTVQCRTLQCQCHTARQARGDSEPEARRGTLARGRPTDAAARDGETVWGPGGLGRGRGLLGPAYLPTSGWWWWWVGRGGGVLGPRGGGGGAYFRKKKEKKNSGDTHLVLSVSSLRRGHANLLLPPLGCFFLTAPRACHSATATATVSERSPGPGPSTQAGDRPRPGQPLRLGSRE